MCEPPCGECAVQCSILSPGGYQGEGISVARLRAEMGSPWSVALLRHAKIPSSRHVRMDGISVQDRTGGSQWNRLSWMALTARSASSRSMMQEILISLVEIIWMLMLLLASASNMLAATPLWLCMPAPTMDTLA